MSAHRVILVGVDESHIDSRDAITAANALAVDRSDKVALFSAIAPAVDEDSKRRLLEAYKAYSATLVLETAPQNVGDVCQALLKEATRTDATIIAVGAGHSKTTVGTLGSLAGELLKKSSRPVFLVRPHHGIVSGKPRTFAFACDGSEISFEGLALLARFVTAQDAVTVFTVSGHHGDKDKAILDRCRQVLVSGGVPDAVVTTTFCGRKEDLPIGAQICAVGEAMAAHILVVASSRLSGTTLGSTAAWVATHSTTSVLVLKVSTVTTSSPLVLGAAARRESTYGHALD